MATDVTKDRLGFPMGSAERVKQLRLMRPYVKISVRSRGPRMILSEFLLSLQNEYERCCGMEETKE